MAAARKFIYLCIKVKVASKIKHAATTWYRVHFLWYKKSQIFEKKLGDEAKVVQCLFNHLPSSNQNLYTVFNLKCDGKWPSRHKTS